MNLRWHAAAFIFALWLASGIGCDLRTQGTDGYRSEERIYDEQENLGLMEESVQVGWQDHGQSTGGYAATPSWQASLVFKTGPLDGNPDVPGQGSEGGQPGDLPPQESDKVWGYTLGYGNVILSPTGESLFAMVPVPGPNEGFDEAGVALTVMPLPNGSPQVYPQVRNVQRVNFSPDGQTAFFLSSDGRFVTEMALANHRIERVHDLPGAFSVLDVSPDGLWLTMANLPRTPAEEESYPDLSSCYPNSHHVLPAGANLCEIAIVELSTGHAWAEQVGEPIRDVDFAVQSGELVIIHKGTDDALEGNHAVVQFYDLMAQAMGARLVFPNCADELHIMPGEQLALLSPTYCASVDAADPGKAWSTLNYVNPEAPPPPPPPPPRGYDPISFLDLKTHSFIKNLPGFGPIAVTADGKKAVGFTRKKLMEEQWNYYGQKTDFGLVVVDVPTRTWKIHNLGQSIPSYFLSPDGEHVIVHNYVHKCRCKEIIPWDDSKGECIGSSYLYCKSGCCQDCCTETLESNLFRINLYSGMFDAIDIPLEPLLDFAWTPDGSWLFLKFESGLRRLSSTSQSTIPVPLSAPPDMLGMRPQGDYLILGQKRQPTFMLYSLESLVETMWLNLNALGAQIVGGILTPELAQPVEEVESPDFNLVRLAPSIQFDDSESCTANPGPDVDSMVLERQGPDGMLTQYATEVVWVGEDLSCPQAGPGDPLELLGVGNSKTHSSGLETGHFSLNGRAVVVSFGAVFRSGDTIKIHEALLADDLLTDLTEAYDVQIGTTDAETGNTEWLIVASTVAGTAHIAIK